MEAASRIASALRTASFWLALASVLVGPLGVEATAAAMDTRTCGVSCPCDAERDAEHAEVDAGGEDESCSGEEAPCDDECPDECPDGCPDCSCCPGTLACVVSQVVPTVPGCNVSSELTGPPDAPSAGTTSGVFRPPRSLT